jgi:prolyl-tRNA synthetase
MAERHGPEGETLDPVVAVVRGDTTLNETKLAQLLGGAALRPMTADEIRRTGAVAGYASPIGLADGLVVADTMVVTSPNLVAGANQPGRHLRNVNAGRDWQATTIDDIVDADEGDACSVCRHPLRAVRGVEVGNIFKLGTAYSTALDATYLDPEGQTRPIVMGSYGIGVGRLLACVAEEHHDSRGLRLPPALAPFQVHLTVVEAASGAPGAAAERVYASLEAAGIEVLYDDRGERAGVQFADADLIGVPLRLTVSERSLGRGGVELKRRSEETSTIAAEDALVDTVRREWRALMAGEARADDGS